MQEHSPNWTAVSLLILKITLFLAVASHLTSSIHMPQFFEHLARGHWIVLHKAFPNTYLWAANGSSWQDPNWIFEILISLIETNFGESGLIILKITATFFVIYSLYCLYSIFSKNYFFAALLSIFVVSGVFVSSDLLPYCLSIPLGAYFVSLALKSNHTKLTLVTLITLAYLLANIDAAIFLVVAGTLLLVDERRRFFNLAIVLIVALFAPPYFGMQALQGLKTELNALSWDILLQRKAANIFDFKFAFLLLLWMLIGVKANNSLVFNKQQKALFFVSTVFSIVGLASADYLSVALIVSAFLLSTFWTGRNDHLEQSLEYLQNRVAKFSPIGILWVLVAICVITIKPRINYPLSYALLPKKEVDLMLSRGIKLPLYHDSFVGSYLSYRLATAGIAPAEVVISSMQSQGFSNKNSPARMEYLAQSLNPHFLTYFDFVAPKSVICRQSEPLCSYLAKDKNWQLVTAGDSDSKELFGWNLFERND